MTVASLRELGNIMRALDPAEPFPAHAMRVPRGKSSGTQQVSMPTGYLDQLDDATPPVEGVFRRRRLRGAEKARGLAGGPKSATGPVAEPAASQKGLNGNCPLRGQG